METVVSAKDVIQALSFACKMTGLDLDESDKKYYLSKLKGRMSGSQVVAALEDMIEKGKKPTLANMLAYEIGGFDDTETAYAKAIASMTDESKTCLLNDCISKAWSVAKPLYSEGMKFDASKAFKSMYEQEVLACKQNGIQKPKWFLSYGTDKVQREEFIQECAGNGLLSIGHAMAALPHLSQEEIVSGKKHDESEAIKRIGQASESDDLTDEDRAAAKQAMAGLKALVKGVA